MKRIVLIYFLVFALFSVCYLFLFHTPLFQGQKVLFYRGVGLLFFSAGLFFILAFIYCLRFSKKNLESIIAAIVVTSAIHLALFVVFPVTFERSVTMYLLNILARSRKTMTCQGLTKTQLENKLIHEYVVKNKAIDKRIYEQRIVDIITGDKECISLSTKGLVFLNYSELVKKMYDIK